MAETPEDEPDEDDSDGTEAEREVAGTDDDAVQAKAMPSQPKPNRTSFQREIWLLRKQVHLKVYLNHHSHPQQRKKEVRITIRFSFFWHSFVLSCS